MEEEADQQLDALENKQVSFFSLLDYEHEFSAINDKDFDNVKFNSNVYFTIESNELVKEGSFKLFHITNPSLKRILCYLALKHNRDGTAIPLIIINLREFQSNQTNDNMDDIANWIKSSAFERIMRGNIVCKNPVADINIKCLI